MVSLGLVGKERQLRAQFRTVLVVDDINDDNEMDRCPWSSTGSAAEPLITGQRTEGSGVQVLKETFPTNTEEEIIQALVNAGSRDGAAEKLLATELSSEPIDPICR